MNMIQIINNILLTLYVMATLCVLRHGLYFVQSLFRINEEETYRYKLSKSSLYVLAIAIGYVITGLINGIVI